MTIGESELGQRTVTLNTNSYISIGLMVTIVLCAIWINNAFHSTNEALKDAVKDIGYRLDKLEVKTVSNPWNSVDMFKWAVRLQKDNPSVKVPEPKHED